MFQRHFSYHRRALSITVYDWVQLRDTFSGNSEVFTPGQSLGGLTQEKHTLA